MRRFRHLDVILILAFCVLLFGFVSLRIFTKEILQDRFGVSPPGSQYILYDLNTTIDLPVETEGEGSYQAAVTHYRHKLEAYTTSAMAFNQQINALVEGLDRQFLNIPATYSNLRYVSAPSENVVEFAAYLAEKNIPFLYVSTPWPDSVLARLGEKELYENRTTECSWLLLQNLRQAGIPVLDLAEEMAAAGLTDYDVSNHWFPENALYSAKVLAEELNTYGFHFRPELFDIRDTWDYLEQAPDFVDSIEEQYGYRYAIPIPNAANGMTFTLSHEGAEYTGAFEDAYFELPVEIKNSAYHHCSRVVNQSLHRFYNPDCADNAGKRLLIIGDSFDWILDSYLSVDIEWIDAIHNASFSQSIREYIEETAPDMVLIAYSDAECVEIYTEEAFRL